MNPVNKYLLDRNPRPYDTRISGGILKAGETREIQLAGVEGLPREIVGVTINVSALPLGPLGYITVWPGGERPGTSLLNAPDGQPKSNFADLATRNGKISIFATNDTHLFIDVWGYYLGPRIVTPTVDDAWTDWQINIPEPPVPKIAAGESYQSMGNTIWRITDESMGGGSWQHYYSDRSTLSSDSKHLVLIDGGGGTQFQRIDPETGAPVGKPFKPSDPGGTIAAEGMWSPVSSTDYCTIVGGTKLVCYEVLSDTWTLIRDFAPELKGLVGGGKIMYFDGHQFVIDFADGKIGRAIIFYHFESDEAKVFAGTRASDWPNGRFLNGTCATIPKSGKWHLTQADGAGEVTRTFRHPWGTDPFLDLVPLAGKQGVFHGTSLTNHHVRVTSVEPGLVNGFKNPPDWITAFRKCAVNEPPMSDGRLPWSDIFLIPASYGMSGIHLSANGKSDDWITAGLYQERGDRIAGPLAHEIIAVDTRAEATHDPATRTIKQGRIRRLAHHHSWPAAAGQHSYWSSPRPSMSLDQRFVVFTSSLGPSGRNDVFALKLPELS